MDERQRQYQAGSSGSRQMGRGHRGREKTTFYFKIIVLLLVINIIFSFYLQMQIGSIRKTLDQALYSAGNMYDGAGGSQVFSGKIENQQFSSGGSFSHGTVESDPDSAGSQNGSQDTKNVQGDEEEEEDYVTRCGLSQVDKPAKRTYQQVLKRLAELGEDNQVIQDIYDDADQYPDKMLEALANNPEMADFVSGYLKEHTKYTGGFTKREKEQEFPLFLQWDPRWGYEKYGEYSNIGIAGCGPTCLSMVMYYLLENEELTPDQIAEYSTKNGYYVWGTGTAWALLEDFPAMYGVDVRQPGKSEKKMKEALDQGRMVICSMEPGDFTAGGHFIVIYGYDEDGFMVNDPNCVARSRKSWTYDEIGKQIKNVWTFGLSGNGWGGTAGVTDYNDDRNDGGILNDSDIADDGANAHEEGNDDGNAVDDWNDHNSDDQNSVSSGNGTDY